MMLTQANYSMYNVVVTITTQQQIHRRMSNEEINGEKKSSQLVVKDNYSHAWNTLYKFSIPCYNSSRDLLVLEILPM